MVEGDSMNTEGDFCPVPLVTPPPTPATTAPTGAPTGAPTKAPTAGAASTGAPSAPAAAGSGDCASCQQKAQEAQAIIANLQNENQGLRTNMHEMENFYENYNRTPAFHPDQLIPDPCADSPGWSDECELLMGHCFEFMTMKKHCALTCHFCVDTNATNYTRPDGLPMIPSQYGGVTPAPTVAPTAPTPPPTGAPTGAVTEVPTGAPTAALPTGTGDRLVQALELGENYGATQFEENGNQGIRQLAPTALAPTAVSGSVKKMKTHKSKESAIRSGLESSIKALGHVTDPVDSA